MKEKNHPCHPFSIFTKIAPIAIILYLAQLFYPAHIVLGNHIWPPFMALLLASVAFLTLSMGIYHLKKKYLPKKQMESLIRFWYLELFAVNAVSFWVIARFAGLIGLGLASWKVVLILAGLISLIQSLLCHSCCPGCFADCCRKK